MKKEIITGLSLMCERVPLIVEELKEKKFGEEMKEKDFGKELADRYYDNIDSFKSELIEIRNSFIDKEFYLALFRMGQLYEKMKSYEEDLE